MQPTPCDKFDYNSDDYNLCIKDIVYEQAQDEWIMLDPRFPNIKGITPKRIDEFLANADSEDSIKPPIDYKTQYYNESRSYFDYALEQMSLEKLINEYSDILNLYKHDNFTISQIIDIILTHYNEYGFPDWDNIPTTIAKHIEKLMDEEYLESVTRIKEENTDSEGMKDYFEDYLQHVMVYDRDDIVDMCSNLGKQIEKKYPGKLHSPHSIFVTTPRGGHEVLSIFAYTNDLKKEQIPSHIRGIPEHEYEAAKHFIEHNMGDIEYNKNIVKHYENGNNPIFPVNWLEKEILDEDNTIKTVFIIDDIIASGDQMLQAYDKINKFFNKKVEIIPVVLVSRESLMKIMTHEPDISEKIIWNTQTVGIDLWEYEREFPIEERGMLYDMLITVRFPWGSPDGESDKILTTLYESRRGFERIERKQRRCAIEPDKCELK